jgi:hypothetical protein
VSAARPPPAPVFVPPAARFRKEIEAALVGGADPAGLLLQLTLSDASRLLRDRDTPAGDIRFDGAAMRFLGVQVEKGVETSALVALPASEPDQPEP